MTRYRRLAFVAVSSLVLVCMGMVACGSSASVNVKGLPQPTASTTKTAIALAPPSIYVIYQAMNFTDPSTESIQLACPGLNDVAIGGGFRFEQQTIDPTRFAEINSSYPVSSKEWKIFFSHYKPVYATVYVECMANPATNVFITKSAYPSSGSSADPSCPAGSIVVGGGFSYVNGGTPLGSYPLSASTWETDYDGTASGYNYAVCYEQTLPVHMIRNQDFRPSSDNLGGQEAGARSSCPAGTTMTSGGYQRQRPGYNGQTVSYVNENHPDPQNSEWTSFLVNTSNPVEISGLTEMVECVQF